MPTEPEVEPVDEIPAGDPPVEGAPAEEVAKDEPVVEAAGDDNENYLALLDEVFKNDEEAGRDPSKIAAVLNRQDIESLDSRGKAAVRALAGAIRPKLDALALREKEWEAKRDAEQRKLDEGAAELRRRSQAMNQSVNFDAARKAAAAPRPKVDATTPEGLEKLAAHLAEKAAATQLLTTFKDIEANKAVSDREAAYDKLKDTYPDLRDTKVDAEFAAFMAKENEGVDRSKGEPWRMNAVQGARIFFADRRAAEASKAAEAARSNGAADRAATASAINRTGTGTGAAGARTVGIPAEVYESNGVTAYLASLPLAQRNAVIAEERRRAMH